MVAFLLEVLDKEPWVWDIWLVCLPLGLIGFYICRSIPWCLAIFLFLAVPLLFYALPEIEDPIMRNAIIWEAGLSYYLIRLLAILLVVILPIIGTILNVKNKRKRTPA